MTYNEPTKTWSACTREPVLCARSTLFDIEEFPHDDQILLLQRQRDHRIPDCLDNFTPFYLLNASLGKGKHAVNTDKLAELLIPKVGHLMMRAKSKESDENPIYLRGSEKVPLWTPSNPKPVSRQEKAGAPNHSNDLVFKDVQSRLGMLFKNRIKEGNLFDWAWQIARLNGDEYRKFMALQEAGEPKKGTKRKQAGDDGESMSEFRFDDLMRRLDCTPDQCDENAVERFLKMRVGTIKSRLEVMASTQVSNHVVNNVLDGLWKLSKIKSFETYLNTCNASWTAAVFDADSGAVPMFLDFRNGYSVRPLELADHQIGCLKLSLPPNFEEICRKFPYDCLRELDSHMVSGEKKQFTRWTPKQEREINDWVCVWPEHLRDTVDRLIKGYTNIYPGVGGFSDMLSILARGLLGVSDQAKVGVPCGPKATDGSHCQSSGKSYLGTLTLSINENPAGYGRSFSHLAASELFEKQSMSDIIR